MKVSNAVRLAAYRRVLFYAKRINPGITKIRAAASLFLRIEGLPANGKAKDTIVYLFKNRHPAIMKIDVPKLKRVIKNKNNSLSFYDTPEWQELRVKTLKRYGLRCMKCGAVKCELHVDHIKPRSLFPEIELHEDNLQVLCRKCNAEKGNKNFNDYRLAFDRFITV